MDVDLSTCSERFFKGVRWLENELKFDEDKIKIKVEEKKEELLKEKDSFRETAIKIRIEILNKRLRLKYVCSDVEAIYILKKVNSKLADEFISTARDHAFWEDASDLIFDDPHTLWFLKKVGLGDDSYFLEEVENLIKRQSVEGFILSNDNHSGPLRVLVETKSESKTLFNAVSYWLSNWKDLSAPFHYPDAKTVAIGVLALIELDYEKYSRAIREEIEYLKSFQNEDGFWARSFSPEEGDIIQTSYAVWAISRVDGIEDSSAQKGLEWLVERQQEDGSWGPYTHNALLALLAMGEGPKVPLEFVDYQFMRSKQSLRRQKPVFIHTSPLYQGSLHVKEIYNRISEMLQKAKKEIRIASPFFDVLYEQVINLKQDNPSLLVKIITRPKREVAGMRERIAKNVVDLLEIATKGNVVQSALVHSRMIIIDDEEVLVSSADLTRDQLFDEFNAGIWTSDKETVKKATDFFENLFQLEKQKKEKTDSDIPSL